MKFIGSLARALRHPRGQFKFHNAFAEGILNVKYSYLAIAVITSCLIGANQSSAAPIIYSSRATFDAAFPAAQFEGWDTFAIATTFANNATAGGITYSNNSGFPVIVSNLYPTTSGANTIGESNFTAAFNSTDTVTFTFAQSLSAFGIDIYSAATSAGAFSAKTNQNEVVNSSLDPFSMQNAWQFVGFSSTTAFTSVTISSNGLAYVLDSLRFVPAASQPTDPNGAEVPEPTSIVLWGVIASLGYITSKRKRLCELVA